jgi:hypothetical protein
VNQRDDGANELKKSRAGLSDYCEKNGELFSLFNRILWIDVDMHTRGAWKIGSEPTPSIQAQTLVRIDPCFVNRIVKYTSKIASGITMSVS